MDHRNRVCHWPQGLNLALWRIKKKISKAELSRRADVSPQVMGQYERGTREPTYSKVLRLCEALGIDVEDLEKKPR
jgi:transcriptional regulator with XRE-family HTH domain